MKRIYELRAASCELRVASCELRDSSRRVVAELKGLEVVVLRRGWGSRYRIRRDTWRVVSGHGGRAGERESANTWQKK